MTHKQNKKYNINRKYYRNKKVYDEANRAVLCSSEDEEKLAIESSRARLMLHVEDEAKDHEFYRSNQNNYVINKNSAPKLIYSTYPTLVQGLRWSPSIAEYTEDSQTDTCEEDYKSKCKCHRCRTTRCSARERSLRRKHFFKDNIAKFADNSTMTRNLTDTGCGVCATLLKSPTTSESSMSTSVITVREVSRIPSQACPVCPVPILKKTDVDSNYYNDRELKHRVTVSSQEAIRDNIDYEKLLQTLTKPPVNVNIAPDDNRKVIYNEGISNEVTHAVIPTQPLSRMRLISQTKLYINNRPNGTNKCVRGKPTIPYNHRQSKYHDDCREPKRTYAYSNLDDVNLAVTAPASKQTCLRKPIRCERVPSIRLPRKLLTSERYIEKFVGTH